MSRGRVVGLAYPSQKFIGLSEPLHGVKVFPYAFWINIK